ncbi:MAG: PucR family transcriptional regulator ligand-binding domain-containing protein [Chloroflexi bacterium]|nr:PucR family transcriptional regulator ligand-binding domain-containing protein [Chloroflexota bacterium]
MTLTVAQALRELPVLSKARVVAGSTGLDRTIRWTHIIDHPDVVPWVQDGHLLLTTAFALMLHPEEQAGLVRSLNEKRLAGMMVNVGRYMLEIPPEMTAAADAAGFPLIALPWEVDFAEVTHAIHEYILREQYALAEQADHIHQTLTRIVLEGGDLAELTRQLAEILHCSVTIEDESLRLMAHTTLEPTDEVRARSIQLGRTPDEVVEYLRTQGVFEHLRRYPRPYHLPPNPGIGFTLERIVSPILVGSQLFGYIWIIASNQPLTGLEYLVIERGAVVAALILSRQEAIYETEQRLKTQLFEGSLNPDSSFLGEGLPEAAWQAGLRNGYAILALDAGNLDRQSRRRLTALVEEHMRQEGLWTTAIERGQRLAVVLGITDMEKLRAAAERLAAFAEDRGFQITVGISAAAREVEALRRHYQQAEDTLTAAAALEQGTRRVWAHDDLGFLGDLLIRSQKTRNHNRYTALLDTIEQYDREKNTQYLPTLETYLDHLSSANQAAQALFIHRNTLYQRLSKITDLWGIDFQDPLAVLNLNLAFKVRHIDQPQ